MDIQRFQKAISLRDSGRLQDAVGEFDAMARETTDANEKASLLINEVRCYSGLGYFSEAERVLSETHELRPDDVVVRLNVDFGGACLAAQKRETEKAALVFGRILRDYSEILGTPEYRDLYEDIQQRRASAMVDVGRCAEAVPILRAARSFNSLKKEILQQVKLDLGICHAALGESVLAEEEFLEVINFGFNNEIEAQARFRLGIVYFTKREFLKAKQQLEAILRLYQDEIASLPRKYVYEQLSRSCHYLGDEASAKRYMGMAEQTGN